MEDKLNIAEILKDAPKGTKLWSPICGDCILDKIDTRNTTVRYAIHCLVVSDHSPVHFTSDGKYAFCFDDGECVLFPSKDNRDWQKFEVPKEHKHFEPFQKVLVRSYVISGEYIWSCAFYSHYDESKGCHHLVDFGSITNDDYIISYEGNEDKLGKTIE